jgi:hypothetical protein
MQQTGSFFVWMTYAVGASEYIVGPFSSYSSLHSAYINHGTLGQYMRDNAKVSSGAIKKGVSVFGAYQNQGLLHSCDVTTGRCFEQA